MAIKPVTVSHSASTPIPLEDERGNALNGTVKLWNPVTNTDSVALHLAGDAGVTPVAETHSTASLTVVSDTTAGAVELPDARVIKDDNGEYWIVDTGQGFTHAAATAGTGTVTVTGNTTTGAVTIPAGSRVCKTGENVTGPFWATDAQVVLPAATYSTVAAKFTIDNDGQAVTIPADQKIKKSAVATTWGTDAETVVPSATYSTAVVQFTGAQGTTYPANTDVKKAAVATIWHTDAEAIVINGVTATAGTCLGVELVGTAATVIAAGSRICKTGEDVTGPFWTLDSEVTIGGTGIGHGNFTCTTLGAIPATAGQLNVIKDATAGWTGVENDAAATPGLAAANGTIGVGVTCTVRGDTAATAGTLDTVVGGPVGHVSVTNALAATPGLPIVATVAVNCTCDVIGDEAAAAGTLDTIVSAPANVSAVTNDVDAVPGASEVPTANVAVTCLTKDAIAALGGTLVVIKDAVAGWTSVTNANPVTPGTEKDYSDTVTVTARDGGAIAADAGEINALETAITGIVSITNAAPATPGLDAVVGSAADFTLLPGMGHPFDGQVSSAEAKALGSAPVVVQLLSGADALQDDARIATQTITGTVALSRDVAAALVGDHATTTGDTAPTSVAHGYALPTTGARETITLAASITAAGAGTITGTCWLWDALATTPAWYPLRAMTFGNAAAVAADTDQLTGAVAEITWPRGVTRICWQTTAETGAPSARRMTITA